MNANMDADLDADLNAYKDGAMDTDIDADTDSHADSCMELSSDIDTSMDSIMDSDMGEIMEHYVDELHSCDTKFIPHYTLCDRGITYGKTYYQQIKENANSEQMKIHLIISHAVISILQLWSKSTVAFSHCWIFPILLARHLYRNG